MSAADPLGVRKLSVVPLIDYTVHPGFLDLAANARANQPFVQALVDDIDRAYRDLQSTERSSNSNGELFRQEVDSKIERLLAYTLDDSRMTPEFADFTKRAFGRAREFLQKTIEARNSFAGVSNRNSITGEFADRLAALKADGFCEYPTQPALAYSVWKKTGLERAILRRRAARWPHRHCGLVLQPSSQGYQVIANAVEQGGILDIASAYLGKPATFYYAALDYAHRGQSWYKDCYSDKGLPTSRTVYMHFDADADVVKAMLYLVDVGPDDGPFCYVRGSHHWQRSSFISALQNGFDVASTDSFQIERDHLDYKLGYYRPRFKLPEQRQNMLLLPPLLRGTTHFGDDILDDTDLSRKLLSQEVVFKGPTGTCVLFDGSRGIHRGSLVTTGGRWAVQIGLRVQRETSLPRVRKRGALRKQLRKLSPLRDRISHAKHIFRELYYLMTD